MSVPVTESWFSIDIRRNRKSYIFGTLVLFAVFAACLSIWYVFAETQSGRDTGLIIFTIPAVLASYLLGAQRLRDLNLSGWFVLFWIPLGILDNEFGGAINLAVVILLAAIPGTVGPNKYGDDPLETG